MHQLSRCLWGLVPPPPGFLSNRCKSLPCHFHVSELDILSALLMPSSGPGAEAGGRVQRYGSHIGQLQGKGAGSGQTEV